MDGWGWVAWVATMASLLVGIAGGLYGWWARSHPRKGEVVLSYETTAITLPLSENPTDLEVFWQGTRVPIPWVLTIRLTNRGPLQVHYKPDAAQRLKLEISPKRPRQTLSNDVWLMVLQSPDGQPSEFVLNTNSATRPSSAPATINVDTFMLDPGDQPLTWILLANGEPQVTYDTKTAGFSIVTQPESRQTPTPLVLSLSILLVVAAAMILTQPWVLDEETSVARASIAIFVLAAISATAFTAYTTISERLRTDLQVRMKDLQVRRKGTDRSPDT